MEAITIHEHANEAGELVRTRLVYADGQLAIDCEEGLMPLPDGALEAVMQRFGKVIDLPSESAGLEPGVIRISDLTIQETLHLGERRQVARLRFRPRFDVIARDYLALFQPEQEPLCELATSVTAALTHLAKSLRRACQ